MKAYLTNMHLLVPRSRSSAKVKVKYKGYISQKMAVSGAFVFHKYVLFFFLSFTGIELNHFVTVSKFVPFLLKTNIVNVSEYCIDPICRYRLCSLMTTFRSCFSLIFRTERGCYRGSKVQRRKEFSTE